MIAITKLASRRVDAAVVGRAVVGRVDKTPRERGRAMDAM
jgi:hypothetical protein